MPIITRYLNDVFVAAQEGKTVYPLRVARQRLLRVDQILYWLAWASRLYAKRDSWEMADGREIHGFTEHVRRDEEKEEYNKYM